jgi:adenosylcobinamide-GDP ribazoletransferase
MRFLHRQLQLFVVAVQFLTRLPTPAVEGFQLDWPVRAARFYPLIGQLVGLLAGAVWLLAGTLWPPTVAAALAVGAAVLITGAFHEDGLADTADGLGGGQTRERKLSIMKDSRIGTFGSVALWGVLILRVLALAALAPWLGALALVTAHGAGRAAAVLAMRLTPYVGDHDAAKGRPADARVGVYETLFAAAWGLVPLLALAAAFGPARAGFAVLLGGAAAVWLALAARRAVGGHTGDVLGGVEQVVETAVLLAAASTLT